MDKVIKKEYIPQELLNRKIWLNYKLEEKNGRLTKVPYQVNGYHASSSDSNTWNTIDNAITNIAKFDGLGFCFTDNLCGIDIDHCINEKGEYSEMAKNIMNIMEGSYIEKSPSGTGLHILFQSDNIIDKDKYYINNQG